MMTSRIINRVLRSKFPFIKLAILFGNLFIPLYVIVLLIRSPKGLFHWLFSLFIIGNIVERAWETFQTSKEKRRDELHGDWTLILVTYTYIILNFLIVSEFFLIKGGQPIVSVTLVGIFVFAMAVRLRWWGIVALGTQWAIHAIGVQKIRRVRVIKVGPYKYVRHPIYLSIMIEELGLCLAADAMFSLAFCFLISIPAVFIRVALEEKESLRRFGDSYKAYQSHVSRLIPTKYFMRWLGHKRLTRNVYAS